MPVKGPKPSYSREQIAEAAVKIADAEGIEAASMRRIASELGSGAASLYRYVENRDQLLDLMLEAVILEDKLPKLSGKWRKDLREIAYRNRSVILRHPWMTSISTFRSSLGPNILKWLEVTLAAVDHLGLDIDEMLVVSNTLFTYARGYASGEIAEREASGRSGLDRREWMISRAHLTHAILKTGKYPLFERVVKDAKAPHDPDAAEQGFARGLEYILDGIAVRIKKSGRTD